MRIVDIQHYAAKVAVYATVATILLFGGGGIHYLSTTKNLTEPGSLAIFGWARVTFAVTLLSLAIYLGTKLYYYWQEKRSPTESRSITKFRENGPR
ncbi:hypothetical protein [Haladaptatus sp. NG-SE-30]